MKDTAILAAAASASLISADAVTQGQPFWFQFMPPGNLEITARVGGRIRVHVDSLACAALQADLESRLKANVIPFFDFDHKGGAASMHPRRFQWRGQGASDGVWCEAVPTSEGAEAIAGRSYRYFSPFFAVSKDGKVLGLSPLGPNCGGLVNDPAFTTILPVAAGSDQDQQPGQGATNEDEDNMKPNQLAVFAVLAARGLLTETEAGADNAADTLTTRLDTQAAAASRGTEVDALRAELATLRTEAAEQMLAAAAKAGRIPAAAGRAPKDGEQPDALRSFWLPQLSDPDKAVRSRAVAALQALPVAAAFRDLPGDRQERAGDDEATVAASAEREAVLHKRARVLVEEARRNGRTLSWPAACAAARAES